MSRKHRRSKAALTKQVATKRDLQRVRDEIIRAVLWATRPPDDALVEYERIERAVNG